MKIIANGLVGIVALEHVGFLILEMFLWTTPFVTGLFGKTPEFARDTAAMAANQGLYNGFLAAGLAWGLIIDSGQVKLFFLLCVIVAGVFGGITVIPSVALVQALPAAIALVLTGLAHRRA